MPAPAPDPPPPTLSYGQSRSAKEGFRTLGLFVGAGFGIVAAIVLGIWVLVVQEDFVRILAPNIARKVVGICFLVATVACAMTVVELRRKQIWFLRGFLVGAGTIFLIIGLMCLGPK